MRKVEKEGYCTGPLNAARLADLLYEIGNSEIKNHTTAAEWYKKADVLLSSKSSEVPSVEFVELQRTIKHARIKTLIALGTSEALEDASAVLEKLETGDYVSLETRSFRLDLLWASFGTPTEPYFNCLLNLMHNIQLTPSSFDIILYHYQKLKVHVPKQAVVLLGEFIVNRVVPTGNTFWIESALITLVLDLTSSTKINGPENVLKGILTQLAKRTCLIRKTATGAMQMVWLRIPQQHFQTSGGLQSN